MANFQYDLGMRETSRGLGNSLAQTTTYRPDNTVLQKRVAGIADYSYTYNANKVKLSETDGTMSNLSQTFGYDFENRLTSWSSNGTTLNQTQSWNLSLEGTWLANTVNGVTENRTFNQAYETLTSNSNVMTHDRKGNLTTNKNSSLYSWDFDNQLSFSTAGTPSVNASYAYDALGRRVSKSSGNKVTIYVSSKYQILTEYVSISSSSFTESQSYIYATYIDEPIALNNVNGTYFYHSNQQFSVGAMTDSLGNLTERYGYNAYGKRISILDSSLIDNPYYFTGRQLDTETGLFYFRARYYDVSLGQFISRDPIGYIDGLNLYRGYFAINRFDPFGLNEEQSLFSGHVVTVYGDTVFGDAYNWCQLLIYFFWYYDTYHHFEILTPIKRDIFDADPNEILADQLETYSTCVDRLNLSGHNFDEISYNPGQNHAGIITEGNGSKGINEEMSDTQAKRIRNRLCSGAIVNICACNSAQNTEKLQKMANKLKRKVCGCNGSVYSPCICAGTWVCKTPEK